MGGLCVLMAEAQNCSYVHSTCNNTVNCEYLHDAVVNPALCQRRLVDGLTKHGAELIHVTDLDMNHRPERRDETGAEEETQGRGVGKER